jgi:hypothetical protein
MFAKFEAEKISSTEFQGILKEQKQNPEVCKADSKKGSSDYCHASEKATSKRTEEMELA